MANTKEIKSRISSVKDTQKITNAMYMISSTKLRKAQSELEHTRPYFTALQSEIKRIFRTAPKLNSRYFYPPDGDRLENGAYGCLVITADKGLAGDYNLNVIREAEKMYAEHPNTKFYVVGEYGRQYFQMHHIPIERSFLYTAQNPTMERAREISSQMLEPFDAGTVKKIFVIYTDRKNGLSEEVVSTRLLPFHRYQFFNPEVEKEVATRFSFYPSVESVLNGVMFSYISGFIYSALVASFCSEQNARMTAMNSANQNAEKILDELSVQYNRLRQAAITQEITEVSAGAKAQRRKKEVTES